tara:strand:+ start:4315 stop:5316 length:1002 start_codon:yes stop_codon:yes gene_type:complete
MKRRVVQKKSDYIEFVRNHNNRTNVYTTVFDFDRFAETAKIESSVVLDRVFFDFDAHGEGGLWHAYADLKDTLDYIGDTKHTLFFSGRGFHLFVFGEVTDEPRNLQFYFREVRDYLLGQRYKASMLTLDERVGQTTRLRRVPNTVNLASDNGHGIPYYCIPIFEEDIEKGIDHILDLAMAPRLVPMEFSGSKLAVWPSAPPIDEVKGEIEPVVVEGSLPILPCLYNAIMVENPSHMARVYLVSWFRDLLTGKQDIKDEKQKESILNIIVDEIESIATSSDEVWLDWDKATTRKHAKFTVYGNYNTPNCKTKLIPEGYCAGKCWRYPDYLDKEE